MFEHVMRQIFGLVELIRKDVFLHHLFHLFILWLFKWWTPKKEVKLILSWRAWKKKERLSGRRVASFKRFKFIAKLQTRCCFFYCLLGPPLMTNTLTATLSHCKWDFMTFFPLFFPMIPPLARSSASRSRSTKAEKSIFSMSINIFVNINSHNNLRVTRWHLWYRQWTIQEAWSIDRSDNSRLFLLELQKTVKDKSLNSHALMACKHPMLSLNYIQRVCEEKRKKWRKKVETMRPSERARSSISELITCDMESSVNCLKTLN